MRRTSRIRHRLVNGLVKRVQIGTITGSTTATIDAVDVTCSLVIPLGRTYASSGDVVGLDRITLTDSTTITSVMIAAATTVRFAVVEFYPGVIKSLLYFTITAIGTTDTLTIDPVDTTKSFVMYLGHTSNDGTQNAQWSDLTLTNSTTITSTRGLASNTNIISGVLVQFQ